MVHSAFMLFGVAKMLLRFTRFFPVGAAVFLIFLFPVGAETPLRVGIREAPPFSFRGADGEWSGIAIELWERAAQASDLNYNYHVYTLSGLLAALEEGEVDVGVAALTILAEREERFNFTNPFMQSGLAIAAEVTPGGWWYTARRFVSLQFLKILGGLAGVVLIFGFLIWLAERKRNEQFGGSTLEGVGSGFWWSAVTMTTVGYGDKSPVTLAGRLVGLVWMFGAILIISGFTAAIASALTVGSLQSRIQGVEDLYGARTGVLRASSGSQFLDRNRISYISYDSVEAMVDALGSGRLDAVVHDAPILRYALRERGFETIQVLPQMLKMQSYAFGLRDELPYRQILNVNLLRTVQAEDWNDVVESYLGDFNVR